MQQSTKYVLFGILAFVIFLLLAQQFASWKVDHKYNKQTDLTQRLNEIANSSSDKETAKQIHELSDDIAFINSVCLGDA